jgi:hypothetical protein
MHLSGPRGGLRDDNAHNGIFKVGNPLAERARAGMSAGRAIELVGQGFVDGVAVGQLGCAFDVAKGGIAENTSRSNRRPRKITGLNSRLLHHPGIESPVVVGRDCTKACCEGITLFAGDNDMSQTLTVA